MQMLQLYVGVVFGRFLGKGVKVRIIIGNVAGDYREWFNTNDMDMNI